MCEHVCVVCIQVNSKDCEVYVVDPGLEFPGIDDPVAFHHLPHLSLVYVVDVVADEFAHLSLHQFHELLSFDGECCGNLLGNVEEFAHFVIDAREVPDAKLFGVVSLGIEDFIKQSVAN